MPKKYTTIGSWAAIIAKALDGYGYDGEALCTLHGVDLSDVHDPNVRYSTELMSPLWDAAVKLSDDPLFAVRAGNFVTPSTFHALSVSMWMSGSLREALLCMERYSRIFSTAGVNEVVEDESTLVYYSRLHRDNDGKMAAENHAHEASVSAVLTLLRSLYGASLQAKKVELVLDKSEYAEDYAAFFGCPVSFGHDAISLHFDREIMNSTLVTANTELLAHNQMLMLDYLNRLDEGDIVSRVCTCLVELLPMGEPSRETVAEALNISLRSLQRKLQEEGTSYKELLDRVRQDLARQFIVQSHLSLGEISFRLGFATNSSFARAFKRWMGVPPGEYRQQKSRLL